MKTLGRFKYVPATSVEDAVSLLNDYESCKVFAGGTDLFVLLRKEIIKTDYVLDLKPILDLQKIDYKNNELHIGPTCTINSLNDSGLVTQYIPVIKQVAKTFANTQVRNRATIGGNIVRSSPAGDMLPLLLVYGAKLKLTGSEGSRMVPIGEFFEGPGKNALAKGEILTDIIIPLGNGKNVYTAFNKLMRSSEDLAKISACVYLEVENGKIRNPRIAVGAVGPIPLRLSRVEKTLDGREISEKLLDEAAANVKEEISPISDVRSSQEYRMQVTGILVRRTLQKALQEVVDNE